MVLGSNWITSLSPPGWLVEMTDYGKHVWEMFPTILGKFLAGDRSLPHYAQALLLLKDAFFLSEK